MEQPQEEAPEAREEEKEEVGTTEGAPELNGGPEHVLPSSSCTGVGEEAEGRTEVQVSVNNRQWGPDKWSDTD